MKKSFSSAIALVLLYFVTSCEKPDYSSQIEPVLEQYIEVWNGDSLSILNDLVDKNFQLRMNPDFESRTGIAKLKESITNTREQFPDFLITETERMYVSDTAIVVRWNATGTFKGESELQPTGSRVNVPGFSVIFFNEDKLTGEWIAYSDLTWYQQLGFSLVPEEKK